ncbi:hypothetical protein H0H81_001399 [Sphagnurus paluster]|uniref:Nas2 N-terminal domain-containing protein n=1 Tax=Sphagnurus paluster TaxID=117069 RepID=A0A9P7K367_9AGAR|nr:hypothetical protein H0H81_001399 [Sphagnurus paluster]
MGFSIPPPPNPMEHAQSLIKKKSNIEAEIESQISILNANQSTLQTPLVDADGFPRADIDVYAVRGARVRIIELRNDLRDVTEEIGKALEAIYDPSRAPKDSQPEAGADELAPFAKVNGVAPGSPAAEAGLQREDLVVKFGPLDHKAFSASSLQPLADHVAANEDSVAHEVLADFDLTESYNDQGLAGGTVGVCDSNPSNRLGGTGHIGVSEEIPTLNACAI